MGLERRVCINQSGLSPLWKVVDIHLNLIPQLEDFTAPERMSDREKSISVNARGGRLQDLSSHLGPPGSVLQFILNILPWPDTVAIRIGIGPRHLIFARAMTATTLRSRLPSLVAGGRRYAAQRTAPKFARFVATPSAEVSLLFLCVSTGCWAVGFIVLRVCAVEEDGPLRLSRWEWRQDGPVRWILDASVIWKCRSW